MPDTPEPATAMPRPGALHQFWQRRVLELLITQLRQGMTPQKIALTIAIGAALGVFPVLGSTTLLCFIAAALLKLNQPIIQLVNYLIYPLQFAGIYFFIRIGEWLTGKPPLPFSIPGLTRQFQAAPWQFLQDFGMTALRGVLAWALIAPCVAAALYVGVLPALRRLVRPRRSGINVNVA